MEEILLNYLKARYSWEYISVRNYNVDGSSCYVSFYTCEDKYYYESEIINIWDMLLFLNKKQTAGIPRNICYINQTSKYMKQQEILRSLCFYDKRNPDSSLDDIEAHNKYLKKAYCTCDNCFYGKTKLAEELLRIKAIAGIVD